MPRSLSERCRSEAAFALRNWRELIVSPWRIIYRVEGRVVFVDSVLDGRRDVEDALMQSPDVAW